MENTEKLIIGTWFRTPMPAESLKEGVLYDTVVVTEEILADNPKLLEGETPVVVGEEILIELEPEMEKHVITQEDLDMNPEMVTEGVKVGDEIGIPVPTEEDFVASQIHADAIAAGKTDEEALELVQEHYAKKQAEIEPTAEETPVAPETAPETQEEVEVAESTEKAVPDVVGRIFEGKKLISARWSGDRLIIKNEDKVEFTLSAGELDAFLA